MTNCWLNYKDRKRRRYDRQVVCGLELRGCFAFHSCCIYSRQDIVIDSSKVIMLNEARIEVIRARAQNDDMAWIKLFHCMQQDILDLLAERKELLAKIEELEVVTNGLLDPPGIKMKPKSVEEFVLSRQKD